jgi:Carbohydrate esterase 2 N-terminal/GDSL-like Lipase/Acylhydrolase family
MNLRSVLLFLTLWLFSITAFAQTKLISCNHKAIRYQGRISKLGDVVEMSWSGSSATIYFKGTGISAILQDMDTANYYNVIIDDKNIFKIHTEPVKKTYVLAKGLPNKKHKVQLFKRTEWFMGKTLLYGFETLQSASILMPPPASKRKIEFYGNSITCGYGIEDSSSNDSGKGYFENNYLTYAAITARYFNAQYSCIARSGIGIMISWDPLIMPEMYDRLDAADSNSQWDFNKYRPDVVVVDLFQNDSWLINMPGHQEFKHRFGNTAPGKDFIIGAYKTFIKKLRAKYPAANIICTLGNMDASISGSPWPGYVQEAVEQLKDIKINTHFFKFKNTPGHPKISEQKEMAESLIDFIEKKIKW